MQLQRQQQHPDPIVRLGGWLFKRRTWLPIPIAVALLAIPPERLPSSFFLWTGAGIVAAGELLRLWAVRHIGVISRTRSDRLGPLILTGPFAWIRNPLYVGNFALWVGFTVSARLLWLLPLVALLLALEYHAIVRWEEGLLEARLGADYRAYATRVPRWIPGSGQSHVTSRQRQVTGRQREVPGLEPEVSSRLFSWRETFFSERGTLVAIVVGYLLLYLKDHF